MNPRRIGTIAGITAGALTGLAGIGLLAAMRRPLPRTSGTVCLPGLDSRVNVLRDTWGVPHIYADTNADLFTALGYVHAQDRLWQMELNRRTGHGQLAELLGPIAVNTDRFVRVLGFRRTARREIDLLDDQTRTAIDAYVHGVNRYLETHQHRLPIEFTLLRHRPRPWDRADVIVWSKIIALNLSGNWAVELMNAHMVAHLGEARASELALHYPDDQPISVPEGIVYSQHVGEGALHAAAAAAPFIPHATGAHPQGSNGWVVSGTRSHSGSPLLANDPHLMLALPSIWYEAHLEGGDYAMSGVTFPGIPAVIIGHNAHIAWGITNAMTDVQDLYIERFDPHNPLRYQWRGSWEEAECVREEIAVRGKQQPVIEDVRVTRHGPVIDPVLAPHQSHLATRPEQATGSGPGAFAEALALRWPALEPGTTVNAALALNRATSWDEFRAALAGWNSPVLNFVYADSAGHYGFAVGGALPRREQGDGRLPVPGWSGDYEWAGYIPPEALPAAYDPPEGYAVNANNRIAGDSYAYAESLQGEWLGGYRAARIQEMINAQPVHSTESFARMHTDVRSLPGLELAHLMADVPLNGDPLVQQARDILSAWDGDLHAESCGGALYAVLRRHLERATYAELKELWKAQAGVGVFSVMPYTEYYSRRAIATLLDRIASAPGSERIDPWLRQNRHGSWTTILQESLVQTVADLKQQMGSNPHTWHYGRVHRLKLRHPFGTIPVLSWLFNRGPWPTGGDIDTVCMGYTPAETTTGPLYIGPSYRMICDTGNWDESCCIITGGQSGHPASNQYCDMLQHWSAGTYHPMLWSRPNVEQHTVAVLNLEPEP